MVVISLKMPYDVTMIKGNVRGWLFRKVGFYTTNVILGSRLPEDSKHLSHAVMVG